MPEQRAHPRAAGCHRPNDRCEPVGVVRVVGRCIEGQEQQGTWVRLAMPDADRLGHVPIAHEHRVHGVAEELLDKQRRLLICGDEIGDGTEHGTVAEPLALS